MKLFAFGSFAFLFLICISFFYSYFNYSAGFNISKLMPNFWVAFNNITLFLTLAVVAYYTYVTHKLRQTAEEQKELAVRPILVLTESTPAFNFINRGNAIAINPCVLVWMNNEFRIPDKNSLPNGIAVNDRYPLQAIEVKSIDEVKEIFHTYGKIIDEIIESKNVAVLCVYRDIYGNCLYSLSKSENHGYVHSFHHGMVGKLPSNKS